MFSKNISVVTISADNDSANPWWGLHKWYQLPVPKKSLKCRKHPTSFEILKFKKFNSIFFFNISSVLNNVNIMCSLYGKLNFITLSETNIDQSFLPHQLHEWLKPKHTVSLVCLNG